MPGLHPFKHSYFYIEMYGDTAGVRTPVL